MEKKKNTLPILLCILLAVVLVLTVVVFGAAMNDDSKSEITAQEDTGENTVFSNTTGSADVSAVSSENLDSDAEISTESSAAETAKLEGTEDFVIFGVDSRENNLGRGTRSDSIMIVRVNHDEKTVRLTSIYRDCMMKIDGHDFNKAAHAHSYGGPGLALDMLNTNLDLQLERYVTVNFINVGDLVDDIGGVEQDIDEDEVDQINGPIDEVNGVRGTSSAHITSAGTYTLDGTQAVAYSRIRHTPGADYKRTERQRTILFKVFTKAKDLDVITRISLAEKMLDEISTNYRTDEIVALLQDLSSYTIEDMTAYPQVFYGGKVSGAWYEVPVTLVDMASDVHAFLYGEENYEPSETVKQISKSLQSKAGKANYHLTQY